jgi:DNA-binding NtrC family response regulator
MHDQRLDLLVLDDDQDLTAAIFCLLDTDCVVRVTNDVSQARRELYRHRPDCLLCDYWLGVRTSVDFLRFVAALSPCTRRVLMSGSPRSEIRPLLEEHLVHAFLAKPLDCEAILGCIRNVVV